VQCHAPFNSEASLDASGRCRLCRAGATHFDAMYCVGCYEGRLRELIHFFKYEPMAPLAKPLGKFLRSGFPRELEFHCMVPMPIHKKRYLERGFNQAELLADELKDYTMLPVEQLVVRTRYTQKQAGLTGKQRRENVKDAFEVPNASQVAGKRILLIDDVLTTGASANACAQVLKKAGASSVAILALARADRRIGAGPEAAIALSQFV
jgi:ComF family protein